MYTQPAPTKRARSELSSEVEQQYEDDVQRLQCELAKENPKRKTIRQLMKSTFPSRRYWIKQDRPVVAEVLDCYPKLKDMKYVSSLVLYFNVTLSSLNFIKLDFVLS